MKTFRRNAIFVVVGCYVAETLSGNAFYLSSLFMATASTADMMKFMFLKFNFNFVPLKGKKKEEKKVSLITRHNHSKHPSSSFVSFLVIVQAIAQVKRKKERNRNGSHGEAEFPCKGVEG